MKSEVCGYITCHKPATKTVQPSEHVRYHFCDDHYKEFSDVIMREWSCIGEAKK